jgi:hypothetical protein
MQTPKIKTVTALRTVPEKVQKLAMVKNHLLEEETKRMTVRRIMRPKVSTDTADGKHLAYYYILASCCTVLFNGFCRLCFRQRAASYTTEDGHVGRNMSYQRIVRK